ncbi:O-antigen acetylase [uncultured Candidatus Thioglobus sp.]|nr:O-antigen acetylase [uncultured Candidatus Thioglobus sp.]SMN01120.1 O-antigen acetylase [uncultured Candidatus Thioglobus sp.]
MNNKYFERLDTIRFYAVFAVIFAHIFQIWTWSETLVFLLPLGNVGVLVFFVLSGFLITKILLSEPEETPIKTSFKNFYLRRSLRIFPIYYLYLLIVFSFNLENIGETSFYPWLYLTNIYIFTEDTWLLANSHLWTLSIEEQFYIVWPFLVLLLRHKSKLLTTAFIGIILIAMLTRVYLYLNNYSVSPQIEVFTLANLDSLTFGGLLALAYLNYGKQMQRYGLPMIIVGLLGYYLSFLLKYNGHLEWLFWSFGKFSIAIFAGGLIIYALFSQNKRHIFHNATTIYLGKISYGLYLYHNIIVAHYDKIIGFFGITLNDNIIIKIIVSIALTVSIAYLSFRFIEKPFLRLKNKLR